MNATWCNNFCYTLLHILQEQSFFIHRKISTKNFFLELFELFEQNFTMLSTVIEYSTSSFTIIFNIQKKLHKSQFIQFDGFQLIFNLEILYHNRAKSVCVIILLNFLKGWNNPRNGNE
ncbi:hypothetical protein BpHYR1_038923 [Brachionus plicatilis]|uniref:Uncharacterized protein n=1 Tax=Brachionus plicatilis TaxID=10195 RepID=A0A3M7S0F4_BRAPC|nr:hypothetical protein BpHYR1_038923 [Brachionus plicatilis]